MRHYMILAVIGWAFVSWASCPRSEGGTPSAQRPTRIAEIQADAGKPDIYVPYEDLAHLVDPADKAVLMDRDEFETLLAAARTNELQADTIELGQVAHADYSVEASGRDVTLTGKLEVVSMGKGPVAVPLRFAQIGLTRVTLDGKPAPLGYDKQGRLTLIVAAAGSHRLEVTGTTKLQDLSSGGMQFGISLPAAVAGSVSLSAPGDLEIHATVPVAKSSYDRESDRTSAELTLGGQEQLTVVLLGNGRQQDEQAILLGESAMTVHLTRSHQMLSCLYTVQALRRGVRELQFRLPAEWTITDVACPSLVRWSVDTTEQPQDRQTLSVRLRSDKVGATALDIKASADRGAQRWQSPRVVLAGAGYERGYMMVTTGEGLSVRGQELVDARQEDTSAAASLPGIIAGPAGRLYFHWGADWSVSLEPTAVELRRSIEERQHVFVSPDKVTLRADFQVTAVERELFDMSFVLAGSAEQWQIKTVLVDNQDAGFEYRVDEATRTAGERRLTIELPKPIQPEKVANVVIELQQVPSNWKWPGDAAARSIVVPLIESEAQTVAGHVLISAIDDLDALPEQAPQELEAVPVGRMASLGMDKSVQYAYSYAGPAQGRLQLQVSRRRSRISGDAVGLVTVSPRRFTGDWQITYAISRASAKQLYLLADKSIGRKINIASANVPVSSKNIVTPDASTMILPDEVAALYDLWQLDLDHKAAGEVTISVHYERPRTSDIFQLPLVRPICHGQMSEQLAIQASEELALTVDASQVREIDAVDLPPLPAQASRVLAAFRLEPTTEAGQQAAISLKTSVHENYEIPSALATSAKLTTYLDPRGGQRTEAIFEVANAGRQFLTIRLPDGAELWSLRVGDKQAKPQQSAAGDYQVALGELGKPVAVKIVYACQPARSGLKRLRLGGVDLPGVQMNEMDWLVIPPPDHWISEQQTKMQTSDLVKPAPAYIHLYRYLARNTRPRIVWGTNLGSSRSASESARLRRQDSSSSFYRSGGGGAAPPPMRGPGGQMGGGMFGGGMGGMGGSTPPPMARSAPLTQQEESRPAAPQQQQALGVRLIQQGRFTLPVDLVPTAGAGPQARFTGLGTTELVIGLASGPRQKSLWILGFMLVLAMGLAYIQQPVRFKAILIVTVLAVASFLAVLFPGTTNFTNGAFAAGVSLIPLYVLIQLVRRSWNTLLPTGALSPAAGMTAVLLLLWLGSTAQAASQQVGWAGFLPMLSHVSHVNGMGNKLPILQLAGGTGFQPVEGSTARMAIPQTIIEKRESPPVIIPYDGRPDTAEESDKILVPYARFVELWNQAHPDDTIEQLQPDTEISLADVRYELTVGQERLNLLLNADVTTYGTDWAVLGLPMSGLAVTRASLDGKVAQLQAGPKGMVLMVPGGTSGRLELEAVARPEYLGRRGSANFSLPPLPGAVMKVVLPENDLELEVDQLEAALSRQLLDASVEYTFGLGMTRKLDMRWLPKVGGGATDRTLSANSDHDVYAFHWALVGVSRVVYTFSSGDYTRFALLVPAGAMVTELKGTNIRDFRQIGEKTVDGKVFELVEVRLHRAAQKQYELTARWLSPHVGGGVTATTQAQPDGIELPLVRAGDVSRESGTVTLHSAGGMTVKVAQVSGGRRANIAEGDGTQLTELTADRARPVAKYYWPYRPFSLTVQLSRLTAAPKVHLDQLVRINTDRAELFVRANLQVDRDKLFGASFALPAGYDLLSAVGPAVEDFYERSTDEGKFLHIKFNRGQIRTLVTLALARRDVSLDSFDVPVVTYLDHQGIALAEQKGRLAVQVAASLQAQTASAANLKSISPQTLRDWLDARQISAAQFAYRYEAANPSLQLTIRHLPTAIRVEAFAGLVVRVTDAVCTYRLRYNISGSPVDHLSFRLPSKYAPLVAVESEGMRGVVQADAGNDQTEWTVALVNEVTGIVDVVVNFALPIDPATKSLEVVPIETEAPAGRRAIVAVQNMSRHEIAIRGSTNLSDLAVSEQQKLMPPEMTESLQYVLQSFDDDWLLNLELKPAKTATRIQAVVDLLALTTVIDRSGRCRYEAKVALQNRSEQFLRVNMPEGLRLWSAKVASEPVKPAVAENAPEGEVLIPLVKTSPGGLPYDVQLYFADEAAKPLVSPLDGITKLKPPNIAIVGIPVMRTTWSLRLPSGYRYLRPGGNMSPAAGTVEMLSLGIEARLEQLKRLERAYRDVGGLSRKKGMIAKHNLDTFNVKLGGEIREAEVYLGNYRGQISERDYERLRARLGEQKQEQDALIGSNTAFDRKQQAQQRYDLNAFINADVSNAGVAEIIRNQPLLEKPKFITDSEQQQIARLREELEESNRRLNQLQQKADKFGIADGPRAAGEKATDLVGDLGDKDAIMGKTLDRLESEVAAKIDEQQAQIKGQLDQLLDNRLQRHFQDADESHKALASQSARSQARRQPQVQTGPAKPGYDVRFQNGRAASSELALEPQSQARGIAGTAIARESESVAWAQIPAVQEADAYAYTASGTYSLPVTLPAGEVRLDFTRPSGGAELSLWAVPAETLDNLYGTAAVVVTVLVMAGLVKVWPRSATKHPISARHIVGYILLLVVLTAILGLFGVIVSLLVILFSEARRGAFVRRAVA